MNKLKSIRYYTMNSWNLSKSMAFNLKVYNVIPKELQNKVFELIECDDFYEDINLLIHEFNQLFAYEWQAGFNGRSGGYLVLYKGGIKDNRIFCQAGLNIEDVDIPDNVKKAFIQLANDIVNATIYKAKHYQIENETYIIEKTRKVLIEK